MLLIVGIWANQLIVAHSSYFAKMLPRSALYMVVKNHYFKF